MKHHFKTTVTVDGAPVTLTYSRKEVETLYDGTCLDNWHIGAYNGFRWGAKIYDEGSRFGIDDGRVSKLFIYDADNNEVVSYERGWGRKPDKSDKALMTLYKAIVNELAGSKRVATRRIIDERN